MQTACKALDASCGNELFETHSVVVSGGPDHKKDRLDSSCVPTVCLQWTVVGGCSSADDAGSFRRSGTAAFFKPGNSLFQRRDLILRRIAELLADTHCFANRCR